MNTRSLVCIFTAAATWSAATHAGVVESFWTNDVGGDFEDPANWSGPVPDDTLMAVFAIDNGTGAGPSVLFNGDHASHRLVIRDGDPNFVMYGYDGVSFFPLTYSLMSAEAASPSLVVAESGGESASLVLLNGFVETGSTVIGLAPGSTGLLEFSTSLNLSAGLTCTDGLFVGEWGEGVLLIGRETAIACGTAQIGVQPGSAGSLSLLFRDSSLSVESLLVVGGAGQGTLSAGSLFGPVTLTCNTAVVGGASASIGEVSLTSAEGSWIVSDTLKVGLGGHGTVTVSNDADLETKSSIIGLQNGAVGNITVSGYGSTWTLEGSLDVGFMGEGNLTICDGGAVFAQDTFVTLGTFPFDFKQGGVGNATVCGPISFWFIDGDLYVGLFGLGTLWVQDGGSVLAQSVTVSEYSTVRVSKGGTIQPGINGGTLEGDGVLETQYVVNDAVRVGDPVGALSVSGDLLTSIAEFEIAGADPGAFDELAVAAVASIPTVAVSFVDGYVPQVGDAFPILSVGTFDLVPEVEVPALPDPLVWFVTVDPDGIDLLISKLGDTNGDAVVDTADLLELLAAWGPCADCPADFDGNGEVNVTDLLILLSNFDT